MAKGLPIVSGVKPELDDQDYPYYLRVPADDTPLKIEEIVAFYNRVIANKTKQILAEEIYQFGKNNFSFDQTFKPVIDFVRGI